MPGKLPCLSSEKFVDILKNEPGPVQFQLEPCKGKAGSQPIERMKSLCFFEVN